MKKILFAFTLFLIPFIVDAKAKFIVPTIKATSNTFNIPIMIENYEDFKIIGLKLHYDKSKLELTDSSLESLTNGLFHGIEENDGTITIYSFNIDDNILSVSDKNIIATLTFKIIDESFDETNLDLEVTDYSFDEETPLDYVSVSGIVYLKDKFSLNNADLKKINDISWSSSDNSIATVDNKGNVSFLKQGEVTITAKDKDNIIYKKVLVNKEEFGGEEKPVNYIPIIVSCSLIICIFIIIIYMYKKKNRKR